VLSQRSVARPEAHRRETAGVRWRRVALEAARQCRRARLPAIEELSPLGALAGHPAIVVADRGGTPASRLGPSPGDEILLVVGPEGGLASDEVEDLRPWARLDLGPFVLRAETAAVVGA